jgi:hypothetical protein
MTKPLPDLASDNDDYDAKANAFGCYTLAIRECRLNGIREGRISPDPNDPEEMETAIKAGWKVIEPQHHRVSA